MSQPEYVSGFGIPLPLGVMRSALTVGEGGLAPGAPEPQARSDGSLPTVQVTPSGPQEAGTTIELRYVTPGYAPAAGYVVREAADADWQGRDTPLLGVYVEALAAVVGAGAVEEDQSHGVTLPNGTRLVARRHNALIGARVKVLYRAAGASSWTEVTVGGIHDADADLYPCFLVLGSAVLLLHWNTDSTANTAQVDAYQCLDSGATWTRYQRSILPATVSTTTYALGRLRAGWLNGQMMLTGHVTDADVAEPVRDLVMQWASSDRGARLTYLGAHQGDSAGTGTGVGYQDIVPYDNRLLVSVANRFTEHIEVWVVGNVWTPLSSLPFDSTTYDSAGFGHQATAMFSVAANAITPSTVDQALAVLEGAVYLVARVPVDKTLQIIRWAGPIADRDIAYMGLGAASSGYGVLWRQDGTPSDWPVQFCAWGWRGRLELACNWVSDATTYDDQLFLISAGGNSTVVQPFNRRFHGDIYQAGWDWVWAPTSLPTAGGATMASVGTGTASITTTPGRMRITTTADQRYFTWTETLSPTEARLGFYVEWIAGGGVTSRSIAVGIRYGDTGVGWEVELRIEDDRVRLRDVNGAVDGDTVTVDVAGGVYGILAVSATGNVTAGIAPAGEGHERVYQMLANGDALTDDAGAGGTEVVYMVGHRATDTATSEWAFLGFSHDAAYAASTTLGDGQDNPDDLTPIPTAQGESSYLGHGVSAIVCGGPAWVGDEVHIPAAPVYGARNLLARGWEGDDAQDRGGIRLSPASGWRSSAPASPWRLPFQHPSRLEEQVPRGYLFCHIEEANFPACLFRGRTGAVWTTIGLWQGVRTATFVRTGARLVLSGAASTYLRTNDLAGGYAYLDSGAGVLKNRPILRNTGGPCGDGTEGPIVVVDLDPATLDGTEPNSGTVSLYFARATLIVPIDPTDTYDSYSIEFAGAPTAPYTYEGEYRAGKVVIGEIWTVSKADWGIQRSRESNTDLQDLDNGRRIARVRAPRRRVYELPYTSIRTEGFLQDDDVPSWYYLETGGAVTGMEGAEAETIEGVLEELEGSAGMMVYLPVIEADGGATMLRGSEAGIYGRLVTEAITWTIEAGDQRAAHVAGLRLRIEEEK